MWDDVGIVRDARERSRRAQGRARRTGRAARRDRRGCRRTRFNLTWHDWLNLKSLLLVSQVDRAAAVARDDSRGAHFRADFPEVRDLERSRYTCVTWSDGAFGVAMRPVAFTRVKPGETLLTEATAA